MILEPRYIVIKSNDANKILSRVEQKILDLLLNKIHKDRIESNRGFLDCLVIEKDWPEFKSTLDLLSTRVDEETKELN